MINFQNNPQEWIQEDWRLKNEYSSWRPQKYESIEQIIKYNQDNLNLIERQYLDVCKMHATQFENIKNAKGSKDVINALRSTNLNELAERLIHLYKAIEEEKGDTIKFQSLRNFGMFVSRKQFPTPQIGIDSDGLVEAVWRLPLFGTLVLDFEESGDIKFTVLYYSKAPRGRVRRISGELPPDRLMRCIDDFVHKLTAI